MKNKAILIAAILISFSVEAAAAGAGSAAGDFLNIGVGAKAAALGGAMTARAEGVEAIYWNPAGLAGIKRPEASFSHTLWAFETSHTSASFALPLDEKTALGLLVNYFSAGTMDKVDNTGLADGTFTAGNLSAAISYSMKITDSIPAGISAKYISSSIDDASGSAFAADLGIKYILNNDLTFGAGVFNVGTNLKHSIVEEALPMNIKAGLLWKIYGATISLDGLLPSAGRKNISAGAEYVFSLGTDSLIAARAGYDRILGFSAGAGFALGNLNFDYAILLYGDLGNNHRFSIKIKI